MKGDITNTSIIIFSSLVVLSYIFDMIAKRINIPSVIFLIGTGIGIHYTIEAFGIKMTGMDPIMHVLGVIGLILIVLESSLDLKLSSDKKIVIRNSFFAALVILLFSIGALTWIISFWLDVSIKNALVYAVPLGVVSSAVAIPSVGGLAKIKKEFIVYESTFSDILGIMIFNYVILDELTSLSSVFTFLGSFVLVVLVAGLSSLFLLYLINHIESHVKFFLIFAILLLIYSLAKMFHLSSLFVILIFGLMLNNAGLYIKGRISKFLQIEKISPAATELKLVTIETTFLVRTFFFVLFGFSIDLTLLTDPNTLILGSVILISLLIIRLIYLSIFNPKNLFPEVFIAPRGLITIVLFYSIPVELAIPSFSEGVLFFIILGSSLMMMIGLMSTRRSLDETLKIMEQHNEAI